MKAVLSENKSIGGSVIREQVNEGGHLVVNHFPDVHLDLSLGDKQQLILDQKSKMYKLKTTSSLLFQFDRLLCHQVSISHPSKA